MKDCDNCKHKTCREYAEPCNSCTNMTGVPTNWEPQTNYDRIISKTIEELADFIGTHDCLDCPLNNEDDWCAGQAGSCRGNVLEWLKSPAVEVDK